MNILQQWSNFQTITQTLRPSKANELLQIHMGAFNDLRTGGHQAIKAGKTVTQLAAELPPPERLKLVAEIGAAIVTREPDSPTAYRIALADAFPHCAFITIVAMLLDFQSRYASQFAKFAPMKLSFRFESDPSRGNKPSALLSTLPVHFPWLDIELQPSACTSEPKESRILPLEYTERLLQVTGATKIDVMRQVFSGIVRKGRLRCGEVMNIVNGDGLVLCREGAILSMFVGGKEVREAGENTKIDEMCLATELPAGHYNAIFLIDGEEAFARRQGLPYTPKAALNLDKPTPVPSLTPMQFKKQKIEKKGFFGKLFG